MTITDLPRTAEPTPELEHTARAPYADALRAVLADPNLAGFHAEARESLVKLTATALEA